MAVVTLLERVTQRGFGKRAGRLLDKGGEKRRASSHPQARHDQRKKNMSAPRSGEQAGKETPWRH